MSKASAMAALVAKRKAARWDGYGGIGDYLGGIYECDHVSPLSIVAGNLDATVMLILQDWDSEEGLKKPPANPGLGYGPNSPTNKNLDALLQTYLRVTRNEVFATNLFPFVKPGGMSAAIPQSDLLRAARDYALPQVEIVNPALVVCFGLRTFNALRVASGGKAIGPMASAIEAPFTAPNGAKVWCQSHPGALGRNNRNRGRVDRVSQDWASMATALS
ncbi:MAG: uracil-DNA glycosylase family protein [Myxococcota bacterium]